MRRRRGPVMRALAVPPVQASRHALLRRCSAMPPAFAVFPYMFVSSDKLFRDIHALFTVLLPQSACSHVPVQRASLFERMLLLCPCLPLLPWLMLSNGPALSGTASATPVLHSRGSAQAALPLPTPRLPRQRQPVGSWCCQ